MTSLRALLDEVVIDRYESAETMISEWDHLDLPESEIRARWERVLKETRAELDARGWERRAGTWVKKQGPMAFSSPSSC